MTDFVGTGIIALFYGHVASNIGDLAINRGEVALLRKAFPNATIRVVLLNARQSAYLSRGKASFRSAGSVEFVHFRADDRRAASYVLEPGQLLDDCGANDADLVVLAAGEHLFHYTDQLNHKNLFWRTLPAFAARQRGRHCLIMPSTFGPFESTEATSLMRALFATKPRMAARDAHSVDLLAKSDLSGILETALDPAFFIEPPLLPRTTEDRSGAERVIGLVMRSEALGLRLGKTMPDSSKTRLEGDYRGSLAYRFGVSFAERVLASGSSLRVFIQTVADKPLCEAIAERFADTSDRARIEIVTPASVEDYLYAIAAVDGVVASRFHAIVLALVAARPCFGVHFEAHGHKMPGLFDMLEQPSLCLDLSRTEPGTAAEVAISGLVAAAEFMPALETRLAALRQHTMDWLTADWNVEPATGYTRQTLDDLRPLSPIAVSLTDEAALKLSAQVKRLAEMDGRMKGVHDDVRALQAEFHAHREKLAATEQLYTESRKATASAEESLRELDAALEDQTSRLNEEVQYLRGEVAVRDRDISVLRTKANRERRLAAKIREDLTTRVEMLEQSESFRVGSVIVRVVTAPIRFLRRLRGRASIQPSASESQPESREEPKEQAGTPVLPIHELAKLYATGGAEAIVTAVCDRTPDLETIPTALVQASRQMIEADIPAAEYPLVCEALNRERSEQTLRAMFWATQRAGKVRDAWNYLTEIQEAYGPDPTPSQSRWLAKARSGAIMNLGLLDEIEPAPRKAFVPIADRICYILHNSLPYSSGGYATRAHGLALGLSTVGVEAICITRPGYPFDVKPDLNGTTLPTEDVIDDIAYVRLWEPKRGGNALSRYVRGAADALEVQFRQFRPALVMAASAHLSALPALIAAKRLGLPFIYEVRGFWEITRLSREPEFARKPYFHVQKLMEAEIANNADHVFTLTAPMRDELTERGVPAEKISLLPNSCDPDRFVPRERDTALAAQLDIPSDVPVIGYIGTFVQYEGLENLALACSKLRARGMVFRLMLVGNEDTSGSGRGPITEEIERIASEKGLTDWLIMPGRVPHEEVEAYYSLIDIAPFPRKPQPVTEMVSPMKPLEALSMEKAVVVSSVRALTEFISDGETGLIFAKGNVESLADTLARLITDSSLRDQLGRNARAWVSRERTWVATATEARRKIQRVISDHHDGQHATEASSTSPVAEKRPSSQKPVAQCDGRDEVFDAVHKLYVARDRARGKVRFPSDDWERTRLAFEILEGARTVVDIGIGQAQLANLLARCPDVGKIYGFDFRNYSTRIDPPANGRYEFRVWDITRPLIDAPEPVDVVVAMEVLEHIAISVMPGVFERLRALASAGAVLITVPYREQEPLYHHDQRHGHKQSFDDARIEELFGPGCLYTNYKKKWYFIFTHDALERSESLELLDFCERVQKLMHQERIDLARRQIPAIG